MVLSLAACGSKGETAEEAFSNGLNAIKTLDYDGMKQYFSSNEILGQGDGENQLVSQGDNLSLLVRNLDYKIVSSTETGDQAIVVAEITNLNIEPILGAYFGQAMEFALQNAFSSEPLDEEAINEQMEEMLVELLGAPDHELVTTTVEVALEKADEKWTIDASEGLQDAIFGGLFSVLSGLSDF